MKPILAISRRTFTVAAAGAVAGIASLADAAEADVSDRRVISQRPENYHGWPTVAKAPDGQLLVVCSGGRESHVCPFGRVELMRSHDNGETWTWPEVVLDGPIDDRDAGVLITKQGSILITTFTSLAYESSLSQVDRWDAARKARWLGAHQRLDKAGRQRALGVWMTRSVDGGTTFSGRYDCLVNSPHGPIQLQDGRLLYAGKELWHGEKRIGVCVSEDDGASWKWLAQIPTRPGDDPAQYHELHAVECPTGKLVLQIRNHNAAQSRETLQSESDDGGATWSVPHSIGVWGLPSHLLRLSDGRLLMSYGYRRKPFGNQARVSADQGKTWSPPMIISDDGPGGDLGYPSTVELDDGQLLTVWYERLASSPRAVLRQARWKLS